MTRVGGRRDDPLHDLLREAGITSPIVSREAMSGGTANAMSMITLADGFRCVLRAYDWGARAERLGRQGADTNGRLKEMHVLARVGAAGVPAPVVLASRPGSDDPDGEVPATLLSLVPGRSLWEALAGGQDHLLREVGVTLRKIHSITYAAGTYGWITADMAVVPQTPTWGGRVAAQIMAVVPSSPRPEVQSQRDALSELAERLPVALHPEPPVLLHNDATPFNVMVSDEAVTGWCDWEAAYVGCGTVDLARMEVFAREWLDADTRPLYDGYGEVSNRAALDVAVLSCVLWLAGLRRDNVGGYVDRYIASLDGHVRDLSERL